MGTSLIYRSAAIYELTMRLLYGCHYSHRFLSIAELIPEGCSVLDLCCGPGKLYHDYLRQKSVRYTGLDVNPKFIRRLNRRGGNGRVWNLDGDTPLPSADYVVMQSSLYHFLPDVTEIIDRMLRAAQRQVIIAEPIRNLSASNIPFLAAFARRHANAGLGGKPLRFSEETLDAVFDRYASQVRDAYLIAGGREKLYIVTKRSSEYAVSSEAEAVLGGLPAGTGPAS